MIRPLALLGALSLATAATVASAQPAAAPARGPQMVLALEAIQNGGQHLHRKWLQGERGHRGFRRRIAGAAVG